MESQVKLSFCMIGSGNVATHLARALCMGGAKCDAVYSKELDHAKELASSLDCVGLNNMHELPQKSDVYIISVSDIVVHQLCKNLIEILPEESILVHTAGSISIDVFNGRKAAGVIYPLQTFSKKRTLNFSNIPIFIESSSEETGRILKNLVQHLSSEQVYECDSKKRKQLHLAAVFACNFVNNMYHSAFHLLQKESFPLETLEPLMKETLSKALYNGPENAQTGPAYREDENVMSAHVALLEREREYTLLEVYKAVSTNIKDLKDKYE